MTQILLPVILATLALVGGSVMVWLATFGGYGDVSRWAAIAAIWLTIPVIIAGLIVGLVLAAMIYLAVRVAGLIPAYSYLVQRIMYRIEDRSRSMGAMVRKPLLAVRAVGELVRSRLQKVRERM